ncbi:MAG TPA: hypothetical protein VFY23_07205 [Candidatus Limnocylindrales bacterium]|nr:hypothetical protein [Candidatus Limnocylindrales bacterium]
MADDRSTTRPPLRVVSGGSGDPALPPGGAASHVCTWCALRFASRAALDRHHATSTECRANQKVSSPLQTRYGDADMVWTQPGEHTLNRVRAKSCRHVHPRARLVDAAGATIGYQCGWCYSVLRDDLPS